MDDLLTTLCDPLGVVLRREAIEYGIDDNALARLVRAEVLQRQRYGAYVLTARFREADVATRHLMLCAAALRQYADHAAGIALSHDSSCVAQSGPTWGLDLSEAHLTHLQGAGRRSSRLVHHQGACRVGDLRRHDGAWVTVPGRAVLEVTATRGIEVGLVQANHFLHTGETTKAELLQLARSCARWPGSLGHSLLLRLADGRLESPLESRSDYFFFSSGLPMPTPQVAIHDAEGRFIGRVDFAWPEQRVVVEVDGQAKYHRYRRPGETIEQMVLREKAREDALREAGWIVIRLVWRDLERPAATLSRLRRALGLSPTGNSVTRP